MDNLDILTQLKQAISSAKYCEATPEYRGLAVQAELERAEHLVDKLLRERTRED